VTEAKKPRIPEPMGEEVEEDQLLSLFKKVKKDNPRLSLFDGHLEIDRPLLRLSAVKSLLRNLTIDELPTEMLLRVLRKLEPLYARATYFVKGSINTLSFHTLVKSKTIFDANPAYVLNISGPVKRISNLYTAFPSKKHPVFLDIPISGSPSTLRVIEISIEKLRIYSPKISSLISKKISVEEMKIEFVGMGETLLCGEIKVLTEDNIEISLERLSDEAEALFEKYLKQAFMIDSSAKVLGGSRDGKSRASSDGQISTDSKLSLCALIIEDKELRFRLENVINGINFMVKHFESYSSAIDYGKLKDVDLFVLDAKQEDNFAVDLLKKLVDDSIISPVQFILVGKQLADARENLWDEIGNGLFVRPSLPDSWIATRISKWLKSVAEDDDIPNLEGRPLILVADDDMATLVTIKIVLTNQQYRVVTSENGEEVIQAAQNLTPNLILLDCNMPVKSGLEALEFIRSYHATKNVPVVMVTGHSDSETVQGAIEMGISGYITKPFREIDLINKVKSILGD